SSFLSGGIDSPLIAACMASDCDGGINTFAIGFEDRLIDESDASSRYAALIGARHHARTLRACDVYDLLDEVIYATSEPLADEGIFPTLAVSKLARERATVALS